MSVNIHDSGYKKLFSNHTIFRQLLETFVGEAWVKELDFSRCETLDKSFVADHYKETESDLIYKVGLRGQTIYIYILIEFQSSVARFMAVRVLNYITSFYLDYIASQEQIEKLPAIFPLVLYNGERTWTAPQDVSELIEAQPGLGGYALRFKYWLLAENHYSREQLLKIRNIVSTLFLAEAHYEIDLLEEELLNLYEREADKQAVSLFLNWFRQLAVYGKVSLEDYAALDQVYRTKEEVRTMLVATLEQERKSIYMEGRVEGVRQTLLQLLEWRFHLSETEQANLTQQLTRINDVDQLSALIDYLLQTSDLPDFMAQVTRYASSPQPTDELKK
jgi:predicted transposase/invertase (TIGR01784 family)